MIDSAGAMAASTDRRGWIEQWDPEDGAVWEAEGRRTARRNLAASMFAEHLAFGVWVVWTVVVLDLADAGIKLKLSQLFLLTLLPNLVGSLLRLPYTYGVLRLGGRVWTALSAAALALPALLLAVVVPGHWLLHQSQATQMWVLGLCAASSGLGGGNFASSMANISFFFPERRKGWALGLNAAGGNLGVATAQLIIPLVVVIGVPASAIHLAHHRVHLAYAGWVWIPFISAAAVVAWRRMDSIAQARTPGSSYRAAVRQPHTWALSLLYVGTFGSFIGYSFALPLVIKTSFPTFLAGHPFIATYLAGLGFLGALLGSLARPLGGQLADRFGGALVTLVGLAGMAALTGLAVAAVKAHDFPGFLASFCGVFVLAGAANGSTYKLIPTVFAAPPGASDGATAELKRRTAAVIGIAGSAGALGGVAVQAVIRQASLHVSALEASAKTGSARAAVAAAHAAWSVPALWTFFAAYLVLGGVTWALYLRRSPEAAAAPTGAALAMLGAAGS